MPLRRPSSEHVVFAVALIGSLALHVPLYGGLGYLAKLSGPKGPPSPADPVEVAFVVDEPSAEAADPDEQDEPAPIPPPRRKIDPPTERPSPAAAKATEVPPPTPPPAQAKASPATPTPPPPPEDPADKQAIQQRSDDPDVAPPDDARFISDENRRVEEETVARLRNHQRDDAELSPGRAEAPSEAPELGNDERTDIEDARDVEGSDARTATEREARAPRPPDRPDSPPPAESRTQGAAPRADDRASADGRAGEDSGGEPAAAGGAPSAGETLVVDDGQGRFAIRMPAQRRGEGGPEADGRRDDGRQGRGRSGAGRRSGEAGSGGGQGDARGRTSGDLDLRVSWADFEQIYGEERLAEERRTFVEERRSRFRGQATSADEMRRFRAAIENYVPNVRPGNQTALNAAASPFANYLAAVHRRIHRQYADRFLASLPSWGGDPHADRTLMTKLEIILNQDGTVHRVGVVRTSGLITFDYGAYKAVLRGQPYPRPPSSILSGDGRVYFHWGFYRNERQCGTFNARPFVLPNPPGSGDQRDVPGTLRDEGPAQGGVIPGDARPTWGTDRPGDADGGGDGAPAKPGSGEDDSGRSRGREGADDGRPVDDQDRDGPGDGPAREGPGDGPAREGPGDETPRTPSRVPPGSAIG